MAIATLLPRIATYLFYFFKDVFHFYLHVYILHVCTCPQRLEEDIRAPGAGLQAVGSLLSWVLEIELRSSARAVCTVNP